MPRTDLPLAQSFSKSLFNRQYAIEIAAWIHAFGQDQINPSVLTRELRDLCDSAPGHSSVVEELVKLESLGFLVRLEVAGPEVLFERMDPLYFEFCAELRARIGPAWQARLF